VTASVPRLRADASAAPERAVERLPAVPAASRPWLRSGTWAIFALNANERDATLALVSDALLSFRFLASGPPVQATELRVGQGLPDGTLLVSFGSYPFGVPVNERGEWLVAVTASDGTKRLLTPTGTQLRTGTPSPIPGRTLSDLFDEHDLNDLGGYAALVRLSGDPATDELLIKNPTRLSQAERRRQNDPLRLLVAPSSGLSPLSVQFGLSRLAAPGIIRSDLDPEGNGASAAPSSSSRQTHGRDIRGSSLPSHPRSPSLTPS